MDFTVVMFYVLAAILIFAALRVVMAKNPVHAVLYLVLSFFTSAGLWLMLQAEFLAITLVLVYVGAVMVLFLFVVMMLDIDSAALREGFWKNLPVALIVAAIMGLEMILILSSQPMSLDKLGALAPALPADFGLVKSLGRELYTVYLLPFEIAAVVLLLAMVAAIGLTMRVRKGNKAIDPALQVKVRSQDRLRVLKMEAVSEEETVEKQSESTDKPA